MSDTSGQVIKLLPLTPAEDLAAAAELGYGVYRREIQRLYDEHPLFAERLDVSMADLEDFVAEALMLPSMLQENDPLSFFTVGNLLGQALRMRDDGSALFLLQAGRRLLQALESPICTQIRLRNIMEMAFDGMERATQQERLEQLRKVYPDIAQICDSAWMESFRNSPLRILVNSVYHLRLVELALYFGQEKQRIARCEYCWNYFVPKTKAETHYCDRSFDGQSCKQRGANLKRRQGLEQDEALRLFKQLRDRMYARMLRYEDAPESQRKKLIPMTCIQFTEWEENVRQARRNYIAGKTSAEEFLRQVDRTHELSSYETVKQELPPEESIWQKRVAADLDFDPVREYPPMLSLDLCADNP